MKKGWVGAILAAALGAAAWAEWGSGARSDARTETGARLWRDDGHDIFRAIAYDAASRTLTVEFRRGYAYRYREVPAETHGAFVAAGAKGAFYNERLRGRYVMERAPDRCLSQPSAPPAPGPRVMAAR